MRGFLLFAVLSVFNWGLEGLPTVNYGVQYESRVPSDNAVSNVNFDSPKC